MGWIWVSAVVFLLSACGASQVIARVQAAGLCIFQEATDYSSKTKFEYIIVGGGAAGCSLATTLSQRFRVLLLERGGSPYDNPNITSVNNVGDLLADVDGPGTPAQGFVSTDGVANIRARILGGGTSINFGFYNRGSPDEIRELGLDGHLANASFEWVENVVASIRSPGLYQSAFRSSLLEAGVTPDNGASFDFHPGTQTGASIFDEHGTRRPASNLLLRYADRNKLVVLLHAEAQLILLEGTEAVGVKYRDRSGKEHRVYLSRRLRSEVILCAGTLGSPQLLLLSGIGPASELASLGIAVALDLPGVGKNVSDNPAISQAFPSPPPVDSSVDEVVGVTGVFGSYVESASGVPISGLSGTPNNAFIIEKAAGPFSTGSLALRTLNVTDSPTVTFNYFMEPRDLETCVVGVNTIEEVLLARSFRPFIYENKSLPSGGTVGAPNRRNPAFMGSINATLAEYCKRNVQTIHHHHGGCLKGQVLDSNYAVIGTTRLRVVDGSTFRYSPGTNPQATVMMLGRYVGVQIISE